MAKDKVLFLVHCEAMFRQYFPDPLFAQRLRRSALARKYDRVILLDSDVGEDGPDGEPGGIIWELKNTGAKTWFWSWGYEQGQSYDEPGEQNWVIDSNGHECTWVPTELRDEINYFRGCQIYVGGGYRGECLADWESVLDYMDLDYELIDGLIYPW